MSHRKVHTTKTSEVVMLDPEVYGEGNDYAIFPAGSGAATGLISFQKGVIGDNGCRVEDLMRVVIDKQMHIMHSDRYRAIKALEEMLEIMKREKGK
jgi:hypothetical protein